MIRPTIEQIHKVMAAQKMKVFSSPFSITFGGIRTNDNAANTFNDWLFMSMFTKKGGQMSVIVEGTTDAGLYYRKTPMHTEGTAIIQHGKQYPGVYQYQNPAINPLQKGHKGKEAFVQIKPMDYWRDKDKDDILEVVGKTFTENAGTNVHDMGIKGNVVDNWSAGCCGSTEENMDVLYVFAQLQIKNGLGDVLSFAMLHEKMF